MCHTSLGVCPKDECAKAIIKHANGNFILLTRRFYATENAVTMALMTPSGEKETFARDKSSRALQISPRARLKALIKNRELPPERLAER
jgi:hypothetical protein